MSGSEVARSLQVSPNPVASRATVSYNLPRSASVSCIVYDAAGKQIGQIEVPERPLDIVFGGAYGRTLFILTHHARFSVKVKG